MAKQNLEALVGSVRQELNKAQPSQAERAKFVYDLVREVYDYAKYDVPGGQGDTSEREYLGKIVDAALPPLG